MRPVAKDAVITWADVLVPAGRLCDQLWQQQNEVFGLPHPAIKFDEPPADAVAVNGAANDSSQKLSPVVVHKRTSSTPGSPDTPPQEEEEVPGAFPLPAAGFFMATSAKGSGVRITVPATAALS